MSHESRSLRVPVADGLSLHMLEWSQEGVVFLMLHGFGNEAHIWDDFAPAVAPYYRTLALDLRGHGDSGADSEARYDHESMARDVAQVLDSLSIERAVVMGHSMGARVAMRLAGLEPKKLAGLILVDAGPDLDSRGVLRIQFDTVRREPVFDSVAQYADILATNYPSARASVTQRMARHQLRPREDGKFELKLAKNFAAWRQKLDAAQVEERMQQEAEALWKILRELACPALVVRGAASDVFPAETADRMVEEIPTDARLEVIARAGHSVMVDNPDDFKRAVCSFALGDA